MDNNYIEELIVKAFKAREMSYSPYSHYKVGAALRTVDGKVYEGCNIENAAYSPSNCAERTAFFKAVSNGDMNFTDIAIVGGADNATDFDYAPPCGVCRQVMMEFCDYDNFNIILAKNSKEYKVYKLKDILPVSFGKEQL